MDKVGLSGKYKSYPEYKDSGVEWLDRIPFHWSIPSLKMLIDVRDGTHDTPSYVMPSEHTFPLVTSKDVTSGQLSFEQCKHISNDDYLSIIQRSKVDVGDILMPMIGTVGSPVIVKDRSDFAIKNLALFKTCLNQNVNTSFLNYFLSSNECNIQFSLEARGGVQNFVSLGTLRDLEFPNATVEEQQKIANFLDHETAKIDTLIEKQQQLIKLLKEKRQAVISHAVTKGLNPNAPMRDSRVEWLGEVPEHWIVGRYKFCTRRIVVGIAEAATHAYAETGVPIIRSTNIKEEGLDTSGMLFIKEEFAEKNESKYLYRNDVITVRTGYPGISAVIPTDLDKSQCFTNLVATPRPTLRPSFLSEYLNSHTGKSYFDLLGWGSAQKNISVPILQNIPISWPDLDEQDQIMEYVKSNRNRYTDLVDKTQCQIELLQERRTALISAAVTGKIDVRGWEPPHA
jgi:type I restriction enzyme S subunit